MHQHRDRVHAPVLRVPFLHAVPPEQHRRGGPFPSGQGRAPSARRIVVIFSKSRFFSQVEEQPRKLEHIIKVVHICLQLEAPDPLKESYAEQAQDLVFNENVLLQTLGFDVAIDHPHTHVVKTCHLVKGNGVCCFVLSRSDFTRILFYFRSFQGFGPDFLLYGVQ